MNLFHSMVDKLPGSSYIKVCLSSSCKSATRWGHRIVSTFEHMPLFGKFALQVKLIAILALRKLFLPRDVSWKPRRLPVEHAFEKMRRNAYKAVQEHYNKASCESYISPCEMQLLAPGKSSLHFFPAVCSSKGNRPTMEDTQFYLEFPKGILLAVFDGHRGRGVADFARDEFQKRFPIALADAEGNVHEAFEQLFYAIHSDIVKAHDINLICKGSAAVVCYIDKMTQKIYAATLGDSEANIYRKIDGELKSIPLSCVRDWSHEKEALRAAIAQKDLSIVYKWTHTDEPKSLRYYKRTFSGKYGLNLSRSLGDADFAGTPAEPIMIAKPKITVWELMQDDILVLASDGLKDYVSEERIVDVLQEECDNIAECLINEAIKEKSENVTVIAVKVCGIGIGSQ